MPYKEFQGKTAEEALKIACEELNMPKENLKYDVISYGASGIFGLVGAKKARIRVSVPNEEEEIFVPSEKQEYYPQEVKNYYTSDNYHPRTELSPGMLDELAKKGKEALETIVDAITIDASVTMERSRDKIIFFVNGGNSAILIGKHGQTLDAMQYLVDKIINKKRFRQKIRVRIDVEGYLRTREDNLTKLALRLGEKVKRTGRSETLHPMNAHDRRVIHLALKNDYRVKTQSMGSGYYRKLVIFPQRRRSMDYRR